MKRLAIFALCIALSLTGCGKSTEADEPVIDGSSQQAFDASVDKVARISCRGPANEEIFRRAIEEIKKLNSTDSSNEHLKKLDGLTKHEVVSLGVEAYQLSD